MTSDEQRIAIAQACGWAQITRGSHYDNEHKVYGEPPPSFVMCVPANRGHACTELPNYLSDLNAMHEAEKTLTENDFETYRWVLWDMEKHTSVKAWNRAYLSSTAAQRAEAFLRTLNLWTA